MGRISAALLRRAGVKLGIRRPLVRALRARTLRARQHRAGLRGRGELIIGWAAHYAIGIIFAALLVAICGLDWARHPTPLPALIFGLVTVAVPFFVMQPAMGAGIAASKTPNPAQVRLRSIAGHTVFGIGLYASALATAPLI